jgi:hypothetical protein
LLACFLSLFAPSDFANPMTDNANKQGTVQTGALKDIALHSPRFFPFLAQFLPF